MRPHMKTLSFVSLITLLLLPAMGRATTPAADWPNPGYDKAGTRCSPLDQINRQNVSKLQVAWTYHTRDGIEGRPIECTPLVVDGIMYVTTVTTNLVALDAATGKEIWKFDVYAGGSYSKI